MVLIVFFVEFGVGNRTQYYNIMEIFQSLGEKLSCALPFFHAFTGCETTSSFYCHGKCSFWMKSEEISELTSTFIELNDMPEMITPFHIDIGQRYLTK